MPPVDLTNQSLAWIAALERVLQDISQTSVALLGTLDRKRDAIKLAKLELIATVMEQERPLVDRLTKLDRERVELMVRLNKAIRPGMKLKLGELADAVGGAAGGRLRSLADQMRVQLLEVRKRSSILRTAMEQLSRHLSGVMQTVGAAMSAAGVYGRQGRVCAGVTQQFAVDIKS